MKCSASFARLTIMAFVALSLSCHQFVLRRNIATAKSNFKKIRAGQITLKQAKGNYGDLQALCEAGFLSKDLLDGHQHGYVYRITATDKSYIATAVPEKYSKDFNATTGNISLYLDETGIIRSALNGGKEASATDNPLLDED